MKRSPAIPCLVAMRLLACLLTLVSTGITLAESPRKPSPADTLDVAPDAISLHGFNLQQQVQVTLRRAGHPAADVTRTATLEIADDALAIISKHGVLQGKKPGTTLLRVQLGKLQAHVPITIGDPAHDAPPQFQRDILPILSKLGCNSGGCHGKQAGQNGFKLSVFGFDARGDYEALTQEARGRRLFPGNPQRSLLLLKATGNLPHGGGQRMLPGSVDQKILLKWIEQGAPWQLTEGPRLETIIVQPREVVMQPFSTQQLLVTARYSDGSHRDVTAAAAYSSNQPTIANMDDSFQVKTGKQPGEAAITINYMGQVTSSRVVIPRPSRGENLDTLAIQNPIDALVGKKLATLGLEPSPRANDTMFLRRLYLTTIGTLPTAREVTEFLHDKRPNKRSAEIQRVLDRKEYTHYWTLKWADILMVNPEKMGPRGAYEFHQWLHQQIRTNRPYDQWVRELITASGNSGKYGPVNFFRAANTVEDVTKTVSQAFLGIRMDCAQCHHHPFEKWGQDDFYGMAGFFTGLQRKNLGNDRLLVFHPGHQPAQIPVTNQVVPTQPPGGEPLDAGEHDDPRLPLANWITAPRNPYFARLVANRLWKHYLGRGLVEPEDDLRSTNPAANEPLLNYLAQQVVQTDFDLKQVTQLILQSSTFQLSSKPNALNHDDHQHHSHYLVRRLPAEVLLDAISQVTGSPETFVGMAPGTRAIELWDNRMPSYFLDTFGRSLRESPCECGKSGEPTMAQALHLMNSPEIEAKVNDPAGHALRLARTNLTVVEITNQLCLGILGKPATAREQTVAKALFANQSRQAATTDLMWTLINCYDFLFIH